MLVRAPTSGGRGSSVWGREEQPMAKISWTTLGPAARGTHPTCAFFPLSLPLMNFAEQDRELGAPVAGPSTPCCGQAGSLSYHSLVGKCIPGFVRPSALFP